MLLTALTIRRFVIVGLMLVGLAVLADGIARTELTRAVNASQDQGPRLIVRVAGAAD
jgi:hypothetical protein